MMNKRIFPAVTPFANLEADIKARIEKATQQNDPLARHYAGPETYRRFYDSAIQRLSQPDMLPPEKAAARMGLTEEELLRRADQGKLVLIEIEGMKAVPDWVLDSRGRVKPFHLAIAHEFAESGKNDYFKFMSYLKFMGNETLEFSTDLPKNSLKDVFRAVGIRQGSCRVLVRTPMFEAADRALKNRVIMSEFVNHLGASLTRIGGMGNPNDGGLSEEFIARYVPHDLPHRDQWKREFL